MATEELCDYPGCGKPRDAQCHAEDRTCTITPWLPWHTFVPPAEPEVGRCTLCGAPRIPLDREKTRFGVCTFIECKDPMHDLRAEAIASDPKPERKVTATIHGETHDLGITLRADSASQPERTRESVTDAAKMVGVKLIHKNPSWRCQHEPDGECEICSPASQPERAFMSAEEFYLKIGEPSGQFWNVWKFAEAYAQARLEHERGKK